jgi:hypothetical protein
LLEQAQQSLEAVMVANTSFVLAVNVRQEKYDGLYTLAARIVRALTACESSIENIRDAQAIKRRLAYQASVSALLETGKGEEAIKNSNSISRMDYDSRADTFANLILLLKQIPAYAPNEADLKLTTLDLVLADLRNTTKAVNQTAHALAIARMQRNKVLLGKGGVYETGTAVKAYIRSVFGMRSDSSRELSKLRLAA